MVCLSPIAFITYFAKPWVSYPNIFVAGSSSLQPLFTEFSNKYPSDTDLIVQGGGSGFGLKSAATLSKDIGLASKNPYKSVQTATLERNGYDKSTWENNYLKTMTIGWDSIAIVYKSNENVDLKLSPTDGTLLKVYDMFSGRKQYKVSELIPGSDNNKNFVPYGRTGGANASGTATSFMYESGFNWNNAYTEYGFDLETLNEVEKSLKSGNYLNNYVRVTNESNVETWNKIKYENVDNAIVYLSLSFVLQNYDDFKNNGFKIAWVNGINPAEYANDDKKLDDDFLKSYNWFSPFNIIFSLNHLNDQTKKFIEWIYTDELSSRIFGEQKLVHAGRNIDYIKAMLSENLKNEFSFENFDLIFNLENSDINIEKQWNSQISEDAQYYGVSREVVLKK